jgi:two-component system OmpR family response regulator
VPLKDRRPVVLLAEDDDDMREVIATRLTREGMRVVEVDDGFELRDYLELCRRTGVPEPDVVVTDVRMPGESGPEALLHSQFHHSPVVLIGACINAEARAYGARVGVVAMFEKPFSLQDLVFEIRRLIAS